MSFSGASAQLQSPMRLLLDTDAFCKLAVASLLQDTLVLLGTSLAECRRLPALPRMLRRGSLRNRLGPDLSDELLPLAESLEALPPVSSNLLDALTQLHEIDPGEAQIFAAAAASGAYVVSGDKRALRVLRAAPGYVEALSGRVVAFEVALLALCESLGGKELRHRTQRLVQLDRVTRICFSPSFAEPRDGLESYCLDLEAEVSPLRLWNPAARNAP